MENSNNSSIPQDIEQVDISKLFRLLLMQSKLILGIIIFITGLSVLLYLNAERQYKVKSLVQVLPSEQMRFSSSSPANFLFGDNTSTADIDSIKQLYESRNNIIKIINNLDLNDVDDIDKAYSNFIKSLDIDTPDGTSYSRLFNNGAMLEISLITNDVDKGIEVLDYANNFFIQKIIETESAQARKALNFIDLRALEIEEQLSQKKSRLKNFRTENKTIDVDLEIQSIITNLDDLESKLNDIEIEIEKAKNDYTETNPIFLNLLNQRDTLVSQRRIISSKIEGLPLSQQQYFDLFKDVEITQDVFNELQNRKLEYSLKEASTLGNIRIIDNAYLDGKVSPQLSMIVIAFLLSSLTAFVIAIARGLYFIPISNPAELEDHRIFIPILGVIGKIEENEDSKENERFTQSLESLIVNVQNKIEQKTETIKGRTILFTSPTSTNGKSFVSRNLSKKLSNLNNKVVLIDADYKRGDQHNAFNMSKISLSDFVNLNSESIEKYKDKDSGLYVIPKITKVRSSFDLLYDEKFIQRLEWLKQNFDYVVIDTAPVLSVSDTLILISYADVALCVARHGKNKINEIKQSIALFEQVGKKPDGIVYNCYERPSSYYGYYGLYGNYSYQYYAKRYLYQSYDYENEKD